MMAAKRAAALVVVICTTGCGGGGEKLGAPPPAAPRQLRVTSPDFSAGGPIPVRFSCDGAKARPALAFAGVPAKAGELALVVVDPDAGDFVHWTVYDLAPTTRSLPGASLPAGAREGQSSAGSTGWTPPCPPSGTHRYEFRPYWLTGKSGLAAGAKPDAVVKAVSARAGGSGLLVRRYTRR
jgi:hypothetical protein